MNKVNLILLIIAMFTGFPAVVAVSQNITVTTPSQAYYTEPSSNVVQTILSSSVLSSLEVTSSSLQSSLSSSILSSSSSIVVSSSEQKSKVVEVPKLIEVKPIDSASKAMSDIKKPDPVKETVKPVIIKEAKPQTKIAPVIEEIKPVEKIIEVKPIIASSSSVVVSSSSAEIEPIAETPQPKANLTFAQQITARCEVVGCNAAQLIRVMKCESSGNPTVVGAGLYIGLFQFLPSTFNAYKVKAGLPNGDIYNGSDQIHVASYMFASGQAKQWGCK